MLRAARARAPLIGLLLLAAMALPWVWGKPVAAVALVAAIGIGVGFALRWTPRHRPLAGEATSIDDEVERAASEWDARHGAPEAAEPGPAGEAWRASDEGEAPWDRGDDEEPWRG
jgi:hypothetical protein